MNTTEKFTAFFAILRKELNRTVRLWSQTLLPSAITTVLYYVIFGHVIGGRIGNMKGYPYIQYIAPGLINMSIITSAYASAVSSFFSIKFQRSIEEILVSPMPNWVILAGFMSGGIFRGLLVGVVVTVITLFFTHIHVHSFPIIFTAALISASIFSLAGIINAILAKTFDDISYIPTFVLTPLTYLGGVFYSVDLLPNFWKSVSLFNPILYIISAFRFGFIGTKEHDLVMSTLLMIFIVALLYIIALFMIRKGIGLRS